MRGDPIAAALDSLGYLGAVKNLLKSSGAISIFMAKNPGSEVRLLNGLHDLEMLDGLSNAELISRFDDAAGGAASRLVSKYQMNVQTMERILYEARQPLGRIETFLDTPATGRFAPIFGESAEACLVRKWGYHNPTVQYWINPPANKEEYAQRGMELLNRRDANVEIYYEIGSDTLAVFDRNANEFVTGRINGDIVTFFSPIPEYIISTIDNPEILIRLN